MENIPMEEIQGLWMAGDIDVLLNLIISKTDLTSEEAKRVLMFFEKYEGDSRQDYREDHLKYNEYVQTESAYPQHDYAESQNRLYDDSNAQILEQQIIDLQEENQELKREISKLEKKLSELNEVVMEQVKFIYDWVLNQ
ncbi:hypothetical protein [Candidatus Nitrosopumilus sediminis]|uniref:Uncharacterized protein n=1 Tax=Candidatus Nitrosopumilus sediminis TaxID=1229909 RepID=K0B8H7_9ARCH|nr:hypothetical protein [Candidatus Nitrosopumilus sediminis]AFS82438.1 hypothetical protein NSED_03160 [Candidatus Nitrosopumilus sediminis]